MSAISGSFPLPRRRLLGLLLPALSEIARAVFGQLNLPRREVPAEFFRFPFP